MDFTEDLVFGRIGLHGIKQELDGIFVGPQMEFCWDADGTLITCWSDFAAGQLGCSLNSDGDCWELGGILMKSSKGFQWMPATGLRPTLITFKHVVYPVGAALFPLMASIAACSQFLRSCY